MANECSNHFYYQLAAKQLDLRNGGDAVKLVLMGSGFTFNRDTHATRSDISGSELGTGNGYGGPITLTNQALVESDANDAAEYTADDITITAAGGDIGPFEGACLFDEDSADDTVLGFIDSGTKTVTSGNGVKFQNIKIPITKP